MSEVQRHCSRREARRRHAKRRFEERYGEYDPAIITAIERAIKKARKKINKLQKWDHQRMDSENFPDAFREARDTSRELWRVRVKGTAYRVAFSVASGRIITFLPHTSENYVSASRNAKRAANGISD